MTHLLVLELRYHSLIVRYLKDQSLNCSNLKALPAIILKSIFQIVQVFDPVLRESALLPRIRITGVQGLYTKVICGLEAS